MTWCWKTIKSMIYYNIMKAAYKGSTAVRTVEIYFQEVYFQFSWTTAIKRNSCWNEIVYSSDSNCMTYLLSSLVGNSSVFTRCEIYFPKRTKIMRIWSRNFVILPVWNFKQFRNDVRVFFYLLHWNKRQWFYLYFTMFLRWDELLFMLLEMKWSGIK